MSRELGLAAEEMAARELERRGMMIVGRNWRNRWCELDLVARDAAGIHVIEVKYRRLTNYGTAFDYITRDKAERLRRGAAAWVLAHDYIGPYQIDVVAITGSLDKAPQIEVLFNAVAGA